MPYFDIPPDCAIEIHIKARPPETKKKPKKVNPKPKGKRTTKSKK